MEEDLYDDIFDSEKKGQEVAVDEFDDLYENIHNPEVAETAISRARELEEENGKLKDKNNLLVKQLRILTSVNSELKGANEKLNQNLMSLIETSRVEINRKKNEVTEIRRELEVKINKQCQRSMSKREIEEVMRKTMPKEDPYFEARLAVRAPSSLPRTVVVSGIRVRQQEVSVVRGSAMVQEAASPDSFNVANRQFVKRKRVSSLPAGGPPKKARDNKENVEKEVRDNKENVEKEASTSKLALPATKVEVASSSPDISMISKYLPTKPKRTKKVNDDMTSDETGSGKSLGSIEHIRSSADLKEGSELVVEDKKSKLEDGTKVVKAADECAQDTLREAQTAAKPGARVQPTAGGATKESVKPRSKSSGPRKKSPEPRKKSPEPRKKSPEPRKKSPEPRKKSPEPRKKSPELRKKSPEPRKKSLEPRKGSKEQRMDIKEHRMKSPDSVAKSSEPRKTPEAKTIPNILKKSPEARKKTPEPSLIKPEARKRTPEPRKQTLEPRKQSPEPRTKTPEGSRSKSGPRKRSPEPVYNIDGVVGQWWCSVHKVNFKTRNLLREHRSTSSCFNLKTPPTVADSAIIVSPILVPKELAESRRPITPDELISFSIHPEDELLDFEEESREATEVQGRDKFTIPKVDKVKTEVHKRNKEEKRSDEGRSERRGTESKHKHGERRHEDRKTDVKKIDIKKRMSRSGRRSSRSRSPQSRRRSRSLSRKRGETVARSGGKDRREGRSPRRSRRDEGRSRRRSGEREQRPQSASGGRRSRKVREEERRSKTGGRAGASRRSQSGSPARDPVNAGAEELLRMREELLGQISREELERYEELEGSEDEEVRGILEGGGEAGGGEEVEGEVRGIMRLSEIRDMEQDVRGVEVRMRCRSRTREEGLDLRVKLTRREESQEKMVVESKVVEGAGEEVMVKEREELMVKEREEVIVKEREDSSVENKDEESTSSKESVMLRPEHLEGYSADEIDDRLIPFKKRNFKELQEKESMIKEQIARSRGNSERTVSESSELSGENLKISERSPPLVKEGNKKVMKVSPIKLCLKDVVISRPSSCEPSSSSCDTPREDATTPREDPAITPRSRPARSKALPPSMDDNASFPPGLDISRDLEITDESEAEPSPVKKATRGGLSFRRPGALGSPLQEAGSGGRRQVVPGAGGQGDLSSPEGISGLLKGDLSSTQGISSLLRAPLVTSSLLPASPRGKKRRKQLGKSATASH